MIDDLLSLKAATIERCVNRAREEFARAPDIFTAAQPARDAAILNLVRVCYAARDMSQHLIHHERLGAPQSASDILMIVPTLPRGHASQKLPRLGAERANSILIFWRFTHGFDHAVLF